MRYRTTGLQWLFLLHMYLNRSLFKYELLYSNNTQIQGPQAEGQSFSLPSSYFPSLPLMGGQLLVFPSPLGLSFYKEKNTEFICVLRVMDSLLLLLGECTQTLWKRSVPAQLCPPLSLLIPPQQHPPSPAHSCCCISLLTYKAPSSPILSLPQEEAFPSEGSNWEVTRTSSWCP